MRSRTKRWIFASAAALLAAGLLEAMLQVAAAASQRAGRLLSPPWETAPQTVPPTIPDAKLGVRGNPDYPEHDRRGFRNPNARQRTDIVALGDSQTYGTGVESQEAWPRRLETMISTDVYSMALGSYSPVHSLLLWDDARALHPSVIIEAMYAGNDLYDSYAAVYERQQSLDLKDPSPSLESRIRAAEAEQSIAAKIAQDFDALFGSDSAGEAAPALAAPPESRTWTPQRLVAQHSAAYGLMRRVRWELGRAETEWGFAKAFADTHRAHCEILDRGGYRTLLTPGYRKAVLDLHDVRIAEGLQLSLRALKAMRDRAAADGIRFVVLLIPTKELVFQELVANFSPDYRSLIENENEMWRRTTRFLDANGIAHVGALGALRQRLSEGGRQPYPVSSDGHPNAAGHRVMATALASHLQSKR